MSDKEILQRAIELAIERGWLVYQTKVKSVTVNGYRHEDDFKGELKQIIYTINFEDGSGLATKSSVYELIYNHEFAKALWGERKEVLRDNSDYTVSAHSGEFKVYENAEDWQYHLQNMVISDNPIKYLGNNI